MEPTTTIDPRFSSDGAEAVPWADAVRVLTEAEISWISTVRGDGRPHVTPLLAVWLDGSLHFCTGASEQKAVNLRSNPHVVLTTGCNRYSEGLDVIVEGDAVRVTDEPRLHRLADAWEEKYGPDWRFEVTEQAFLGDGGIAHVFEVAPVTAFGFDRGGDGAQTRWRF